MAGHLTEHEIKEVLSRAQQIHMGSLGATHPELLKAAEEAGLPREAVEKALQERLDLLPADPEAGDLVFAKSADGCHYVAEIVETQGEAIRVRFVKGSETVLPRESLKPCSFLPGQELTADWPTWGWWRVKVVAYSEERREVQVTDGWTSQWFSIGSIRLDPPKSHAALKRAKARLYFFLITFGGIIGSGLTYWLTR